MKFSIVLLAVAGLASATIDQYIPKCAVECLTNAIKNSTPCTAADVKCQCEKKNYDQIYSTGTPCVMQACGPDISLREVLPGAMKFCEDVTGYTASVSSAAGGLLSTTATGLPQTSAPAPTSTKAPGAGNKVSVGAALPLAGAIAALVL